MAKKRQQKIGQDLDRLSVIVSSETGNLIRKLADKKGLSISNFLAEVIEKYLNDFRTELEDKE